MTREEIEKASNKYIEGYLKSSNEYPLCDNRKRMSLIQVDLYKMQKAFERGMKEADKTMIDKACEWLRNNWREYIYQDGDGIVGFGHWENDFRKAMEE